MGLTVSIAHRFRIPYGKDGRWEGEDDIMVIGTLAGDSSYPLGGEALAVTDLDGGAVGVGAAIRSILPLANKGYIPEWDAANSKLKCTQSGAAKPRLIVEETVAIASDVGSLANLPAYIIAICESTDTAYKIVPTGLTPAAGQCAVTFTTGALEFAAADSVATVRVTYIPQQGSGPFSAANMVIDELVDGVEAGADLANRAMMVQYVYDTDGDIHLVPIPVGETEAAGDMSLDMVDGADTSIKVHANEVGTDNLKVTYLKHAGFPSGVQVDQADIVLVEEGFAFQIGGHIHDENDTGGPTEQATIVSSLTSFAGIAIPCLGCYLVGEDSGGSNNETPLIGDSGITAANDIAKWSFARNHVLTAQSNAMLTFEMPWLILNEAFFDGGAGEVPAATDLSSIVFPFMGTYSQGA